MNKFLSLSLITASLATSCAMGMDQPDWGKKGWDLQVSQALVFTNVPESLKGKTTEELRQLAGSGLKAMTYSEKDDTQLITVDLSQLQTISTPETKSRIVLTRVAPVALAFTIGYLLAKHSITPH